MKSSSVTIQIKATEQYFPVVLFIMLYKVILVTFESVYEILKCDHSNKSYIEQYFSLMLFQNCNTQRICSLWSPGMKY